MTEKKPVTNVSPVFGETIPNGISARNSCQTLEL